MNVRTIAIAASSLLLLAVSCCAAVQAPIDLFPRPKEITWLSQSSLPVPVGRVAIVIGEKASDPEQYAADTLRKNVKRRFGQDWPVVREKENLRPYTMLVVMGERSTNKMLDGLCKGWRILLTPESPGWDGYVIQVGKASKKLVAMVGGSTPRGIVYGQDTLFQMFRKQGRNMALYQARVRDWPSIKWRGRPHSDISLYDRPNTYDSFAQARVNFIDLRCGSGIYGTPPGFQLDKQKVARVLKEAHRRGFFVFANVLCAVPKEQYDAVIKTFEEYLQLGADGIYMSIDDPGSDTRIGTPIDLLKRVVELGRRYGITGDKLAMVPGKESYLAIDTDTNRKVAHVPGLENVLLFATCPPSSQNLKKALDDGFAGPPAWWLNWPRPRGGFTHIGNASRRLDAKLPYSYLLPLSEGWWNPTWDSIRDAGKNCVAVMPWGASVWGNEYVAHVLNLWAWAPELHDWTEERRRIYDIVYGPDLVGTAMQFDDFLESLHKLYVMGPDYAGKGLADGPYSWPPTLRDSADRATAIDIVAKMEEPLQKLEQEAAAGSLLDKDQLEKYFLEPMRAELTVARTTVTLVHPEEWWPAQEQRILTSVQAGNFDQAREWQISAQEQALSQAQNVEKVLSRLVDVKDYAQQWWGKFRPIGEARYSVRPVAMKGDLSDPAWAQSPKLGDFAYGGAKAPDPTEVQLIYTDDSLYIGFTCHESTMDKLVTKRTQRDSDVWEDDAVEVFINPDGLLLPYYQFVTSVNGVQTDGFRAQTSGFDGSWNGQWEVKTARFADKWTAEIRIPFTTLGFDQSQKGRIWMCNFVRDDHANNKLQTSGYEEPDYTSYGSEPATGLHDTRKLRPIWFR